MGAALDIRDTEDGVRVLTVSNPTRKNAIDDGFLEQLAAAISDGAGVRAWLLRGGGDGVFSAGYDLASLKDYRLDEQLPDERIGQVLDRLMHHPAPSVALVNGPAFGAGCELAVACDFRVGDPRAVFCMPPARLGVVYALKGLRRFIERVGEGPTRYMFLTGRRIAAGEALRFGLLDVLASQDRAEAEALGLCQELASNSPLAVRGIKQGLALLAEGADDDQREAYEGLRRESFASDDVKEGRAAILEKRPPRFNAR